MGNGKIKENFIMDHYENRLMVAASNYFKSLIFYELSKKHLNEDDIVSSVITGYYSIFHLSVSRIKLYKKYAFDESKELCKPSSIDAYKITHKSAQRQIAELVKDSELDDSFLQLLIRLNKKRNYLNYGPRLSKDSGKYTFDTCSFPNLKEEMSFEISCIEIAFNDYIKSLKLISDKTFMFIAVYKDFYLDTVYNKLNLCSLETIDSAKEFHKKHCLFNKQC